MDDGPATIPVTENLWDFIQVHGKALSKFCLWIDQISINQHDLVEKARQVQLMSRIYENAQRTLIWLGADNEASKSIISVIKLINISWEEWKKILEVPFGAPRSDVLACVPRLQDQPLLPPFDSRLQGLLDKFLETSWFSRLWTLQEAVLSNQAIFLSGHLQCNAHSLFGGLWLLTRMFHSVASFFMNGVCCVSLLRLARERRQNFGLFDLLELTRTGLQCTDPRDKVYALISMQTEVPTSIIDYTMTTQDLFTLVTRNHISLTKNLAILGEVYHHDQGSLTGVPSWVPSWTQINEAGVVDKYQNFRASKSYTWQPPPTTPSIVPSTMLTTRGRMVDVISKVDSLKVRMLASQSSSVTILRENLLELALKEEQNRRSMLESPSPKVTVLRTLTFGGSAEAPVMLSEDEVEKTWAALTDGESRSSALDQDRETIADGYWYKIANASENRSLFWSENYSLGIGPKFVQSGDRLCILHGSSVPVVLRPHGLEWDFVGQCYVDRVMIGEACTWAEDDAETFMII